MSDQPRKVDFVEKLKLPVEDLHVGMFVCELDRPWLETPFLLQGFEIRSDKDIEALRRYCRFVYIDVLRTRTVEMTIEALPPRSFLNEKRLTTFEKEIEAAETTRKQTSIMIRSLINEIRFGKPVDIALAKEAVASCVASVIRNPDVMMFLTQLRRKDDYALQHAFNVCIYSIILGCDAGFDPAGLEAIGTCGLLHDMGTILVPDRILHKEGQLSREEMAIMREHTMKGRDMLMTGHNLASGIIDVAYDHHENLNGSGYPRGLSEEQLGEYCRIVAVADRYDAITSERPYRPAHDHLDAMGILNRMSKENLIDSGFTAGLIGYLGIYPPGSVVELSSGEVAIVLESNPAHRLRPKILVVRDEELHPTEHFIDMALRDTDDRGQPLKVRSVQRPQKYDIDLFHYRNVILDALSS
ncbi:MAG: metal-dependent phosphohydrolase, subdomain [Proteobacteria bacterium]|nr:metal-dependent phosphohydrolase, subdomain [Pseudomonadota bacterium]